MRSLSGRLLLLTILFVMLAEVLIFVPSLAYRRVQFFEDRLAQAKIASLTLLVAPDFMAPPELEAELLENAGVHSIVLRRDSVRELVLRSEEMPSIAMNYDLREQTFFDLVRDAFYCAFFGDPDAMIQVVGDPPQGGGERIEVTIREGDVKAELLDYGRNIFFLSLAISAMTGAMVYLAISIGLVRPIQRVIESMTGFRRDPERSAIIAPGAGRTEISLAEQELAAMQIELRAALRQKSRMAALGEAVAKINHDLRNILASVQLLADRLERSNDPLVRRTAPKLLRSIDRATQLCEHTLAYGKPQEVTLTRRRVALASLLEEVATSLPPGEASGIDITVKADESAEIDADPDQLFRILLNLTRNAHQAIEATGGAGTIALLANKDGTRVLIDVSDSGPGLPNSAIENLFTPFKGGSRKGGTGLGLAIAQELAQAHGGEVKLLETNERGTTFRVELPDPDATSKGAAA